MKNLKGACMFCQSGGPTSVINSSAAGVFTQALKQDNITKVYGAEHGIVGVLEERFFDMSKEDSKELELLKNTPSSALGSARYKLKDPTIDDSDYKRILEVFKKYNVRYFFFNGGNDSMDTCNKISKFFQDVNYDCNVIGVPKTIDNDLYGTDHCPGYASAAKFIANTIMECTLDAKVYNYGQVCVFEIMGRNAGWLTAAAHLPNIKGLGADLIYLPEIDFDMDKFLADVSDVCERNNNKCIIAVSEGLKYADGRYVAEAAASMTDSFGHSQLGGLASVLANIVKNKLNVKVRAIELSLMQRCGAHLASKVDVDEAFSAGAFAVESACNGNTDKMVVFQRNKDENGNYVCENVLMPLEFAANTEKTFPLDWIVEDGKGISDEFIDYCLPLIQGDSKAPLEDGLPRFVKLKKVYAQK